MFMTFDATSREFCTVRRVRTNTPLQALATLNDEGFFEHARALAARMRKEAGPTVDARLSLRLPPGHEPPADARRNWIDCAPSTRRRRRGTRRRLAKPPRPSTFRRTPRSTADEIDLAAWTMVGNVLLNLDETVTKG